MFQTKSLCCSLLFIASSALAQTVTGSGTANSIPVFSTGSSLTNSAITQSNGNIGIQLVNPVFPLDVGGGGRFNWRSQINAPSTSDVNNPAFLVYDTEASGTWMIPNASIAANAGSGVNIIPSVCGANAGAASNCGYFGLFFAGDGSANNYLTMGISGSEHLVNVLQNGSVGIGTTSPGADLAALASPPAATTPILEVNGDIALSQGRGGQMIFPDGTVQGTAWNGTVDGGDYAESIDVAGERDSYEAGDVITIDPTFPGRFRKSTSAYSSMVAGVYATKPGIVGRRTTSARLDKAAEVPMAMMGIVPTKVSAENGPIKAGDLLVSSTTPGYAMKGSDRERLTGAVIGKALAPLAEGRGIIEALISLQ